MGSIAPSDFNPRDQLIPHIVDHYAATKPDAIYAEYPVSPISYEEGYRSITYKQFANAVNGIAWWLTEKLGPGNGEVLAYVGGNDIRYPALVLGGVKAGYGMFLTSPRNSVAAHRSLLKRLNCNTLVAPSPRPPPVTAVLEAREMNVIDVPSVEDLLSKEYPHFELLKTYAEASKENLVVLHTSGSTGIPKPIFWTHETANRFMHMEILDPGEGFESQQSLLFGKRLFLVPPPFHAAGIASLLQIGIPSGNTLVCPTSGGLPTAAGLVEAMKKTHIDAALAVPSIVQELSQSPDLLDYCGKHLSYLFYCGGDLPQQIGDIVASKVNLGNKFGASETGFPNAIYSTTNRDPLKDWRYVQFNPQTGAEMRHVAGDEYELVVAYRPEGELHQVALSVSPGVQEYHTKDLFVRHPDPSKPDLWRWSARTDDVIVFLNGEKTNPVSMEQHIIASNPEVAAALVAGAQRFQASLLVELASGKDLTLPERAAMIEKLWPSIEEANSKCPAHARVAKTHILFTTSDKPMLRAGKGTIQRAGTLAIYEPELEALYADADKLSHANGEQTGPGRVDDPQIISDYIRDSLLSITGWKSDQLTDTANFFHLGLDSLQAITATRTFKQGLDFPTFTPNLIYLHPSVEELTKAVLSLQQDQETSAEAQREAQLQEREEILQEFLAQIRPSSHTSDKTQTANHTVILTGSTGNLGTYILDTLLKNPTVTHIHCLNRRADAIDIHRQKANTHGTTLDESRVSFWTADLSQPDLGLQPDILTTLQQTTTHVIHNAWPVNFNLSLASFKPHLTGVINLIDFTTNASLSPHLFFVSSVGSVMGLRTEEGLTPEKVITTTTPAPNGYTNSKYLAEHLLARAVEQRGIHASFARVGQIAGPVRSPGLWNKTEWFPSLVLSSAHLGAVPDTLGSVLEHIDWVPVDLLAEVLVDLTLGTANNNNNNNSAAVNVFHPVNLHPLSWFSIRPILAEALSTVSGKPIEIIPSRDWIQRVRQDLENNNQGVLSDSELQERLAKNPVAKLVTFFEDFMAQETNVDVLDTRLTGELSEKLRGVDAVKPEWIQKWVGEWMG